MNKIIPFSRSRVRFSFLLSAMMLLAFVSHSQAVIATAGGGGAAGGMILDYTLGESFASVIRNDSLVATQGFHQPSLIITGVEEALPPGAILIFPNPASSVINVQFKGVHFENYRLELYNLQGQLLLSARPATSPWQTDLSHLPGGPYLLRVTDRTNNAGNSFKILKSD